MNNNSSLVAKYNVAGPRYTSYPTVPYWNTEQFTAVGWEHSVRQMVRPHTGISLYIHLPFCESMCTFCGCTKRITKNHLVELPYIKAVLQEFEMYCELLGFAPTIQQLHLGGGTPTFFSAENLETLLAGLFTKASIHPEAEFSFEGHPNNTTETHLRTLYRNEFRRVCYGVQDYNDRVQRAIHRVQSFENVERVTQQARAIGYTSVGHDLVFGLPFQTEAHVQHTIAQTLLLRPDRLAFYSYAHVPWIKGNGQRGYRDADLPTASEKRRQYELGKSMLEQAGYREIGMDHFALPSDDLALAQESGQLHRNFMGYTMAATEVMLGLGVSAIGDSWNGFAQNVKTLPEYYAALRENKLPVFRGHLLTKEDLIVRKHILNLMCRFETSWYSEAMQLPQMAQIVAQLSELQQDGLVEIKPNSLHITEAGKPFVRNVCLPFDLRLQRKRPETRLFSMTV
tara:strand:- start:2772 stop:4133 length:1362 start_codon:yes stop_codon:yes gene_type:complete